MPNNTGIEWADFTTNPIRYAEPGGASVWACVHVSAGCEHCYAERLALRLNRGQAFTAPNMRRLTPYLDHAEEKRLLTDMRLTGRSVFVADMTDLFGEWVPPALIAELLAIFSLRTTTTWMVLTKRPARMRELLSDPAFARGVEQMRSSLADRPIAPLALLWPLHNVWLGVSAETQREADQRIPLLLSTPAAVRFVSAEPLLGPLDLGAHLGPAFTACRTDGKPETIRAIGQLAKLAAKKYLGAAYLDWVIAGGESGGPASRALIERNPAYDGTGFGSAFPWVAKPEARRWVGSLRDQCVAAGVPFLFKQWGGATPKTGGRRLDGRTWDERPGALSDLERAAAAAAGGG